MNITSQKNNKDLIKTSWKTLMEMLRDRKIKTEEIDDATISEIIDRSSYKIGFPVYLKLRVNGESSMDRKSDDNGDMNTIKIVYYMSNKFKFTEIRELYKEKSTYYQNILVIMDRERLSANNFKMLNSLNKNIEIFLIKELQFNISKHELQPKFEILDNIDQINDLLKSYKLKSRSQLPLIMKTDPIAKYFGLKSGDIVKITRKSETSGTYINYRLCQ